MTRFKIKTEEQKGNWARVSLEPLEAGYGHTIGNSLRRCMLTSLPGAAISSVKISGVSHQFATIPGVVEDVIEIILNLKKIRLKIYGDKVVRLSLEKEGKGEVKGKDINTLGTGEIINPEEHIATITDTKAKLKMELTAEAGVGYLPAEEKKTMEIGVIPVDSIYTPVLSVNYTVDQTRVGRRTDFDKLNLEITTDGTIEPIDATKKAAEILVEHFRQIYSPVEEEVEEVSTPSISEEVLQASVEELDLPVRITNALKAIDIDTVGKLIGVSKSQLMKAKNLGAKSLTLIAEKLQERGLSLSEA